MRDFCDTTQTQVTLHHTVLSVCLERLLLLRCFYGVCLCSAATVPWWSWCLGAGVERVDLGWTKWENGEFRENWENWENWENGDLITTLESSRHWHLIWTLF